MDGETSRFSLKAIQQMELNPYSGESDKYVEWYESTERRFGRAAAEPLLHDVDICNDYLNISFAAKCVVANSLEDGSAAYLNTQYKSERNLAKFMKVLDKNFNQHIDAKTRKFNRWKDLFTLTLEKHENNNSFIKMKLDLSLG